MSSAPRASEAAQATNGHGGRRLGQLSQLLTRARRTVPLPLALILVLAALQAFAWSIATAPLQGPDEILHVGYTQHLAETGRLPARANPNSTEVSALWVERGLRPLMGQAQAKPAWSPVDQRRWRDVERSLPPGSRSDGAAGSAASNPPLYYGYLAVPYRLTPGGSLLGRLLTMRLASGALYLTTVVLMWLIAGELIRRQWLQTVATGAVALQPQLAFVGGVVSPDIMLVAVWTAFIYTAVRLVKHGMTMPRVLAVSGLAAASALTHGRGIALLVPAAVVFGVAAIRHRPPPRRGAMLIGAGAGVMAGGTAAALALTSASAGGAYGGTLAQTATPATFNLRELLSYLWQFYFDKLASMEPMIGPAYGYRQVYIESFFGKFGSLEILFAPGIYDLLQVAAAIGLVALYTTVVVRWRSLLKRWDVTTVFVATAASLLALLHVTAYIHLVSNPGDPIITGRYLLPLVALFGLAIAFVVGSLPRRAGPPVAAAILAFGVLLQLAALGMTVGRFYG